MIFIQHKDSSFTFLKKCCFFNSMFEDLQHYDETMVVGRMALTGQWAFFCGDEACKKDHLKSNLEDPS